MNKLAVEELCFCIGLPYWRNFSSALANPSVSRVNNTPEASARYSRCRLTANWVIVAKSGANIPTINPKA